MSRTVKCLVAGIQLTNSALWHLVQTYAKAALRQKDWRGHHDELGNHRAAYLPSAASLDRVIYCPDNRPIPCRE